MITKSMRKTRNLFLCFILMTGILAFGSSSRLTVFAEEDGKIVVVACSDNHSNGWDDYLGGANIFLAPGDQINISDGEKSGYTTETLNFVYMNAGYMGYYKHQNTETEAVNDPFYDISDLTISCFVISDNAVEITRYNNNGETILKDKGIYNRYRNEDKFVPAYPVNENILESYTMDISQYYLTYEWSDHYTKVTGKITDESGEIVEMEEVAAFLKDAVPPSNTAEGVFLYESENFNNPLFQSQNITLTIEALDELQVCTFPNDLTMIENNALSGVSCEAVIIPENCESIGEKAFSDCNNLIYVYVPESVSNMPANVFEGSGNFVLYTPK